MKHLVRYGKGQSRNGAHTVAYMQANAGKSELYAEIPENENEVDPFDELQSAIIGQAIIANISLADLFFMCK
jgi:hypothetical protein